MNGDRESVTSLIPVPVSAPKPRDVFCRVEEIAEPLPLKVKQINKIRFPTKLGIVKEP